MTAPFILPLDSPLATLESAGGKGANLSHLIRGGFPVPAGFIVATGAYDAFVAVNGLSPVVASAVAGLAPDNPASLDTASEAIRQAFGRGRLPGKLADELSRAYRNTFKNDAPVAVRSSATAEDLPDLSFAGQQDTYLNVRGIEAVYDAMVRCWASLWTARAIGYRARNDIPQEEVSLAVVVQAMVQPEAAGVLFTVNPVNGRRTESVIEAALGLGESLVSGQIEPDHYVVDGPRQRILEKHIGAKAAASEANAPDRTAVQALPDAGILELVALGNRVQSYFESPQDIEWAWANGQLSLVQSRAITSLYPLPDDVSPEGEMHVLASFGAFQGVLDPLTPLGVDTIRSMAATAATLLDYEGTWETQGALKLAGERLFINLTPLLRNGFGRRLLRGALSQVEPGIGEAVHQVWDDRRLAVTSERLSPHLIRRMAPLLLPLAGRFIASMLRPEAAERAAEQSVEQAIEHYRTLATDTRTLRERLALLDEIALTIREYLLPGLFPRFIPGMVALNQLYRLTNDLPGGRPLALEVLRGLPHNVTTEMDLALWDVAQRIRQDAASAAAFASQESRMLARRYLDGELPEVAHAAVDAFLRCYGMRGLVEIDLGRPRWCDDPAPVMEAVQSYLHITDPQQAPDTVFARGAVSAQQAIDTISAELRKTGGGRRKAARARWAARRVRALAGQRESPKFTIVNMLGLAREALLKSADELVQAALLHTADDIFFLPLADLYALANAQEKGEHLQAWPSLLQASIEEHRTRYEREKRRRQIPRLMLNDGTVFYEGVGGQEASALGINQFAGSPVSPGVVEGTARVVLTPAGAQLQHGEIMVCPGTDPSWTPLFLVAAGLVMEVGGVMTHGSVVAREYGIPAVVGVTKATERVRTGQRIRVDGSKGSVTILDDAPR